MEFVAGFLVLPVFHSHLGIHKVGRFKNIQRLEGAVHLLKDFLGFPALHKLDRGSIGGKNVDIRRMAILDGRCGNSGAQALGILGILGILGHGRNQGGQSGQYHYY